ncbi:MAG: hypothetical protein CMC14_14450 [Flavobacteriaceae bacterium]|nr:hypothetical protein [Flavobacteriaceae bacterium]|tara:strand:- start:140 stop:520 length:381 start_codon:yes stop_codon:yes gene_type:complete
MVVFFSFVFNPKHDQTIENKTQDFSCGNSGGIYSEFSENSRNLFIANCAACHKKYKKATGPALSDLQNKIVYPSENYLYIFIINEDSLTGKDLERAKLISKEYLSDYQHKFRITKTEVDDILLYLD